MDIVLGWDSDEVLKYFLKSEDAHIAFRDPDFHRQGGLLSVTDASYKTSLGKTIIQAAAESGYPIRDLNGKSQIGFNFLQFTMKNGLRHSTNSAFLCPVRGRRNLHIIKKSHVIRILFDETGRRAIGVEYYRQRKKYKVFTRKEVIISAGAINSPQLLLLSGIGPANHLRSIGIDVLRDLPVGRNLMDHVALGGLTFIVNDTSVLTTEKILNNPDNLHIFVKNHTGVFSIVGGIEALGFFDLSRPNNDNGHPDLELLFSTVGVSSDPTLRKSLRMTDNIYNNVYKMTEKENAFLIIPMIMKPKSKGWIELKDRNPFRHPAIYPNYFSDESDLDILVKGVRISERLMKTDAMRRINARLWDKPLPDCKYLQFNSDDYWKCASRYLTMTIYHLSGTCKMGPVGDPTAVVDPRLRVHGVERLRVIDASIMPYITSAHINAAVIMIAEKGSDLVKQDWGINVKVS